VYVFEGKYHCVDVALCESLKTDLNIMFYLYCTMFWELYS
jgi:hypothetical protein